MGKQQVKEVITIHLFKPGTFASANGQAITFTEENLQEIVDSYSSKDEAPICLGHQANDRPAYGWVTALEKTKRGVDAIVRTTKQVKDAIENEEYKKVSGSLYLPQTKNNPVRGKLYLKHIALLGATAPAIKGLDPIALSEAEGEIVEFSEDIETKQEQKEVEMPKDDKTKVATQQDAPKPEGDKTPEAAPVNDEHVTKSVEKAEELEKRTKDLEKREAEFAQQQAEAKSKDIDNFANEAVANGHIKQDQKQDVKNFMESLEDKATLDFSDDKKETPLEFFKEFVKSTKLTADFSEVATNDKSPLNFEDENEVCEAIQNKQAEAAKNGVTLTAAEALTQIKGK